MTSIPSIKRPLLLLTAAALSLAAISADARERSHSRNATGPNGGHASTVVERGNGSAARSRSVEGANGRGYERDMNRDCVQGAGCSRSVETTTNSGQSWGRNSTTTANDGGGYTRSTTGTTPAGGSVSRETTVTP